MQGYLPLHHAVLNNQEGAVEEILEHFPDTYVVSLSFNLLVSQSHYSLYPSFILVEKSNVHFTIEEIKSSSGRNRIPEYFLIVSHTIRKQSGNEAFITILVLLV